MVDRPPSGVTALVRSHWSIRERLRFSCCARAYQDVKVLADFQANAELRDDVEVEETKTAASAAKPPKRRRTEHGAAPPMADLF